MRHCLCPSLKNIPATTQRTLLRASNPRPTILRPIQRVSAPAHIRRAHNSSAVAQTEPFTIRYEAPPFGSSKGARAKLKAWEKERDERKDIMVSNSSKSIVSMAHLDGKETPAIYNQLRNLAANGYYDEVNRLISYLLIKRREAPNLALYSAAILANVSPELGSAALTAALLRELGEGGWEPTAEICHNIIKVLAVHPDYLFRDAILEYMRQRWFTLTLDGWHDLVAGLLRERQFEIALDHLDTMVGKGMQVEPWLYDVAVYMLCDVDEVGEALRIMRQRTEAGEQGISKMLWFRLLDVASSIHHYAATEFVWRRQVEPGYVNPSSGICLNVLTTAARYGNAYMATEVFRVLGERKEVFTRQHYEMLVDTYIHVGDIKAGLSVMCIMQNSNTTPDEYSTRSLVQWARESSERAQRIFTDLRSLKEEGYTVPLAVAHVVLEALIELRDLDQAIEHYKALGAVCESGPTTETFNILFRGCQKRKDLAMFLAAEMIERKLEPNELTYDRLVLVCLNQEDYEDAFRYYDDMRDRGWMPRIGTFVAMAKRCARAQDERAWKVVDALKERGKDLGKIAYLESWLRANWGRLSEADGELTR